MPDYVEYNGGGKIVNKYRSVDPSLVDGKTVLEITRSPFDSLTKYFKVENGQLLTMTQAEKDALDAAELQAAIDAENARIAALADKMTGTQSVSLTKVELAIDNISNLADAKVFLKRLCRYLAKL